MRVTFLTHYYPPEVGAPQARIATLARLLGERGATVTVHTCFPHYPDGRVQSPYRVRPMLRESDGSVAVFRSAVYPAANKGTVRRLANHASFAASALLTAPAASAADVVVAESPPLFAAAAGALYARMKRAPLVLNVADRWPESAVELGALRRRHAIRAATSLELGCYRAADAISVPTDGLCEALSSVPQARGKVRRLGPGVDTGLFHPRDHNRGSKLRVLYAGTLGLAQGIGTLVDAACAVAPQTMELVIAGDGAEREALERRIAAERLTHVRLLGTARHSEIPALYAESDVATVLLRDRAIFEDALPTKLLEAMAAGRAVVLAARGESARVVSKAGAGVVVPPEDPAALAGAFSALASDPRQVERLGAAGRRCAVRDFDYGRVAGDWWRLLNDVVAGPPVDSSQAAGVLHRAD